MRVKHKNIVRFLGYCYVSEGEVWDINGKKVMAEERQRFLCFEFLPEGSLDKYISGKFLNILFLRCSHHLRTACPRLKELYPFLLTFVSVDD
jgi:serine/threonine protein kinase